MQIKKKHDENTNNKKTIEKNVEFEIESEHEHGPDNSNTNVNRNNSSTNIRNDPIYISKNSNENIGNMKIFSNVSNTSNMSYVSNIAEVTKSFSDSVNINTHNLNPSSPNKNLFSHNNNNGTNFISSSRDTSFFIDREHIKSNFDLLKGENLIDYDEAYYRSEEVSHIGTIVMTDYRLLFKFKDGSLMQKLNFNEDYFKLPFFIITKLEKSNEKKNMIKYTLEVTTKDFRIIKFVIVSDMLKFYANLNNLIFPKETALYFSFAYKYREGVFNHNDSLIDGWSMYDPIKEYARQGIKFNDEAYKLKVTNLNKNFNLCATYPQVLVVPKTLTDEEIKDASLFRTKNRFPVLSYVYSNNNSSDKRNNNKISFASIWRSSQTKSGLTGQNRSLADEKLLKSISQLNDKLVIYDARPYLNALANRIKGGGYENVNNYSNTELHFCEIENIHAVRNSLSKIFTLCSHNKITDNKKFLSSLEQTDWYEYIHLIVKYSNEIAISIKKNYSVLVHCSDGWDRSSQLISLSQILIDPYFRTLEGLVVLIEKEWLNFGHQFALRNGIFTKEPSEDQRAPIFFQWLDCLHQLLIQIPNAFEYNMELLLFLASNFNSNLYGTFLYNCEMERVEKEAKIKTVSIWTDVYASRGKFMNPFYVEYSGMITPNCSPYKMRFWEEYFFKWNNYVKNCKIYLSEKDNVYLKSPLSFYAYNKIQDKITNEIVNSKMNVLIGILSDVYDKTKNLSVFNQFSETTKFYLSNLIDNGNDDDYNGIDKENGNGKDKVQLIIDKSEEVKKKSIEKCDDKVNNSDKEVHENFEHIEHLDHIDN